MITIFKFEDYDTVVSFSQIGKAEYNKPKYYVLATWDGEVIFETEEYYTFSCDYYAIINDLVGWMGLTKQDTDINLSWQIDELKNWQNEVGEDVQLLTDKLTNGS